MTIVNTSVTPGSKRHRTREKLLDVAAELFSSQGLASVSLDMVAATASMTKGAIYGNFANKDDLVFAVLNERTGRTAVRFVADRPVRDQLDIMLAEAFAAHPQQRRHFALLAELDSYALSRPELAARFVRSAEARHRASAEALSGRTSELTLPPLAFVLAVQGIVGGLLFQHACFPDDVTTETAWKALDGLLAADQ